MKISNLNLRNALRWSVILLGVIALADLVLAHTFKVVNDPFTGYTALIIPALILGAYAYTGNPIFQFDASTDVLRIKSHSSLSEFIGKELVVNKKNIQKIEVDRERLRKKLTVYYLKNGKDCKQRFSIALLNNQKIEKLASEIDLIRSDINTYHSPNYPLFI